MIASVRAERLLQRPCTRSLGVTEAPRSRSWSCRADESTPAPHDLRTFGAMWPRFKIVRAMQMTCASSLTIE
ncbi:hypothetical protein PROPHIGD03_1_82 [Mycobacterium phage prophiGD03-1]|nr:hypothetical protein PROPHIGD03_1_82 [Mycobacterium phage prophiGD03-1]